MGRLTTHVLDTAAGMPAVLYGPPLIAGAEDAQLSERLMRVIHFEVQLQ